MTALALARERAPTVPFLIVTGSVNEETAVGCMKAGAMDYLLKSNLARIGPAIRGAMARVGARADQDLARLQLADLVHPDSRQRYREVMDRVVGGETMTHVELVFLTSSGEAVPVEGNLSCTRRDGRPASVRGIYRDIAVRKRVADQLRRAERMQAAGRLAGGVAHEVNNMMTGVIGFAEFLLRSLEPGWMSCTPRATGASWFPRGPMS